MFIKPQETRQAHGQRAKSIWGSIRVWISDPIQSISAMNQHNEPLQWTDTWRSSPWRSRLRSATVRILGHSVRISAWSPESKLAKLAPTYATSVCDFHRRFQQDPSNRDLRNSRRHMRLPYAISTSDFDMRFPQDPPTWSLRKFRRHMRFPYPISICDFHLRVQKDTISI